MSEATDYYNTRFGPQLIEVANADSGWRDRISLAGLIPGAVNATPGQARSFSSLDEKDRLLFLMCFFYSALLDQAIHSSLREEHSEFDHLARYPKLVGILGSANTNLHPANLLVAVTVNVQALSNEAVTALFDDLTRFMVKEYVRFFTVEYPSLTTHLQSPESQQRAILSVCQEVVRATAPPEPDIWRHAFTLGKKPPDWKLAEKMIRTCNQVFSENLPPSRRNSPMPLDGDQINHLIMEAVDGREATSMPGEEAKELFEKIKKDVERIVREGKIVDLPNH